MKNTLPKFLLAFALAPILPMGCKGDKPAEKQEAEVKALPAPANGSPIAAEFVEFTGDGDERGMRVLLYNTGDKTAAGYFLIARYYDADDKLLRVKVGTPFEKDTDFTSLSGGRYKCEPKKNATLDLDGMMLSVPAEAKRAEVLMTKVSAVGADGMAIEDWWSQEGDDWPE